PDYIHLTNLKAVCERLQKHYNDWCAIKQAKDHRPHMLYAALCMDLGRVGEIPKQCSAGFRSANEHFYTQTLQPFVVTRNKLFHEPNPAIVANQLGRFLKMAIDLREILEETFRAHHAKMSGQAYMDEQSVVYVHQEPVQSFAALAASATVNSPVF